MFGWFRRNRKPERSTVDVRDLIRARYDAAQTTESNARLWRNADYLSPAASVDATTRSMLRSRARYECENNSYAAGIAETVAVYTVGRGPKLHIDGRGRREGDNSIERAFNEWSESVCLPAKLRTIRKAHLVDGEAFLLEQRNPRLDNPITLDYRLVEADQIASGLQPLIQDEHKEVDGIRFDAWGNPSQYGLLRYHPGAASMQIDPEVDWIPAEKMIHVFRQDRPGQPRGVSEMAPALNLFIILRQYTQATLEAAASAAYWTAVMKSSLPPDESPPEIANGPFSTFDLERNSVMSLPEGWDITQMKPEHPTTVYAEFKREIVNEIARALNVPYNLAAGNSSQYNFASGRLDWQAFFRSIDVVRRCYEHLILNRIFWAWFDEAVITGVVRDVGILEPDNISWLWDGFAHIDPKDEADAAVTLFEAGLLDEDAYWAVQGQKTDDVLQRMAGHKKRREQLGLTTGGSADGDSQKEDGTPGKAGGEEGSDDSSKRPARREQAAAAR